MRKLTNKQGYLLALIVATIYSLIIGKHFELLGFIANFITIIIICSILGGILMLIFRSKNFGKFLGITTLIISVFSFLGNRYSDSLSEKEKTETEEIQIQKETSINFITSNFKKEYTKFNDELQLDSRKEILNQIIINNEITFGDSEIVLEKINKASEYYDWISKTNDSLFTNLNEELSKYKEDVTNESEKREIDQIIMQIKMTEINTSSKYIHQIFVISELKNVLLVKNNCKHQIKEGKILFFDNKCLEKWNKAELKPNEAIQNSNNHKGKLHKIT